MPARIPRERISFTPLPVTRRLLAQRLPSGQISGQFFARVTERFQALTDAERFDCYSLVESMYEKPTPRAPRTDEQRMDIVLNAGILLYLGWFVPIPAAELPPDFSESLREYYRAAHAYDRREAPDDGPRTSYYITRQAHQLLQRDMRRHGLSMGELLQEHLRQRSAKLT